MAVETGPESTAVTGLVPIGLVHSERQELTDDGWGTVTSVITEDGTPVLDIKPYMTQFGPRGKVTQPSWVDDLMRDYY